MTEKSNKDSLRPQTPSIDLIAIRKNNENSTSFNNFNNLFKQIIVNENKNFLEGEINMIDYIISKSTNTPINKVNELLKVNLKTNADFNLLNQIGERLPVLKELKLTNSILQSIEDLGTNFKNLVILNIDNCGIKDISGICVMMNLREFSAKNNKISDLFELDSLPEMQYLMLESNQISDLENITFLSGMEKLEYLNLVQNPISSLNNYKKKIEEYLPNLKNLDTEYKQNIVINNPLLSSVFGKSQNSDDNSQNNKDRQKLSAKSKISKISDNSNSSIENIENIDKRIKKSENCHADDIIEISDDEFLENEDSKVDFLINNIGGKTITSNFNKSLAESITTRDESNSLLNSHSTFKPRQFNKDIKLNNEDNKRFIEGSGNIFNININESNLFKLNKLKPVKLKQNSNEEVEERNDMKKIYASHMDYFDTEQERKEIKNKLLISKKDSNS